MYDFLNPSVRGLAAATPKRVKKKLKVDFLTKHFRQNSKGDEVWITKFELSRTWLKFAEMKCLLGLKPLTPYLSK